MRDISCTFDKVYLSCLVAKLEAFGIGCTSLAGCKTTSETTRRRYIVYVALNGQFFSNKLINAGVRPLLFFIFINGISPSARLKTIALYAVFSIIKERVLRAITAPILNEDLQKLQQWSEKWNFLFEVVKCKTKPIVPKHQIVMVTTHLSFLNAVLNECKCKVKLRLQHLVMVRLWKFVPQLQKAINAHLYQWIQGYGTCLKLNLSQIGTGESSSGEYTDSSAIMPDLKLLGLLLISSTMLSPHFKQGNKLNNFHHHAFSCFVTSFTSSTVQVFLPQDHIEKKKHASNELHA